MDFGLIETILWEDGDYFLLELHLSRLLASAEHFSFPVDIKTIKRVLVEHASTFDICQKYKVRFVLKNDNVYEINSELLDNHLTFPVKVAISDKRTKKDNSFFQHKTTNRNFYTQENSRYRQLGYFEVLFLNQDDEVTEGTFTNVIIQKDNSYYTPPVVCGLLPGVYRKYLLKSGVMILKEQVLHRKDLLFADKIILINSVRKVMPAVLAIGGKHV